MSTDEGIGFMGCLESILEGKKTRRLEWPDDGTYLTMRDGKVVIFTPRDNMTHPLIVSDGDILAEDWVIIGDKS